MNPYIPTSDYTPDGEPHVFGDRVYVYTSHDKCGGEKFCMLDYVVYSASLDDLNHWSNPGIAYSAKQDPLYDKDHQYMYAPDCVKGNDGRYYLYYSIGGYTNPISVAVSDKPDRDYKFYGHVKNTDGSVFAGEYCGFDPAVMNDEGTIRLYFGAYFPFKVMGMPNFMANAINKRIYGKWPLKIGAFNTTLAEDMLTINGPINETITEAQELSEYKDHPFFEASSIRKFNGLYYFIYSSWYNHELCYGISDKATGGFRFKGTIVSNADIGLNGYTLKHPATPIGNNHGSFEKINDDYYVFYHRQTHGTSYSRQACAEKIQLNPDGTIDQVEMTSLGFEKVLKAEGIYPADCYCCLHNRKTRLIRNGSGIGKHPHLTDEQGNAYITEINNETLIAYKYFDFSKQNILHLNLRGNFKGTVTIAINQNKPYNWNLNMHSEKYIDIDTKFICDGQGSLSLYFVGKGQMDFDRFEFVKE